MDTRIRQIQHAFGIETTGELDPHTKAAIKNFQLRLNTPTTGELDDDTYKQIMDRFGYMIPEDDTEYDDSEHTTDQFETVSAYKFNKLMLDKDEYVTEFGPIPNKKYIFIHHTAGWDDPYSVINDWNNDSRGRIGTHYVVGGINISNENNEHDGEIVQCIPDEYFGWHLGSTTKDGINFEMHKTSIGIELCNFGPLTLRNGKYYTYTGNSVPKNQVCDLGYKFRGYQYWHKYTEKQLHSLMYLLIMLSQKYKINLSKGLQERINKMTPDKAFEYYSDAVNGKVYGILSHTNVRKDKFDVSPQPDLINIIKSL